MSLTRVRVSREPPRFTAIRAFGCIACLIGGSLQLCATEIHHLVDKSYREHSGGDDATIPLCIWHHRGDPPVGFTAAYMRAVCGPSMYRESKLFAQTYGTQRELLAMIDERLRTGKSLKS